MDDIAAATNELVGANVWSLVRAGVLVAIGWAAARLLARGAVRALAERVERHTAQLVQRVLFYVVLAAFVGTALHQLGFQLAGLLGAAGILTVALGFASQTAASNLVSGLFLLVEAPFEVGSVVRVGATTGEVVSIDLLSTTLRTFDNLAVRIPNEVMMKSEITNFSRFPIRRYDLKVSVAYKEDLRRVEEILEAVAARNPLCLEEPHPLLILQGFGESSLDIQFSVWGLSPHYLELRNSIQREVKEAFDAEGVEIPFPHRSLQAGSATAPFPVQLVEG